MQPPFVINRLPFSGGAGGELLDFQGKSEEQIRAQGKCHSG
jgi:hypothetical protein